jgi:hypothetical protein
MLSGEATNTNFIVFGLTQPTIYRIWGESTNHYTPDTFNIVVCGHKSKILLNHSTIQTVDRGLGQTKDYKIGICCFSAKHAALRRKSKDWLNRNQDNVYEWGDMFQWASTIKIQLSMLVVIISIKINLFSPIEAALYRQWFVI